MVSAYIIHILILIAIYIILAVSLDIAVGYTGLLNLGHVAFFGIGAYASALLVMAGTHYFVGMLAGGILAGVGGFILAFPTARLKGDYLALATLGFSFIMESLMRNLTGLTRGPLGIPGIPKPEIFGFSMSSPLSYFIFAAIISAVCVLVMKKIIDSRFGSQLEATRDDEIGAEVLGINAFRNKSVSLTLSAFFAGIAGSLYAHYITFIDPTTFSIMEIILLFSIVIIGGLASVKGAITGTVILILIPEPLRFIGLPSSIVGPARQMIYSLILILILYFRPKGIFGRVTLGE